MPRRTGAFVVGGWWCVFIATMLSACAPKAPPANPPVPPRPPVRPATTHPTEALAHDVIPPGWKLDAPPKLLPLTQARESSRWLLVVDAALELPSEGVRRRLRRFGLVGLDSDGSWRVRDVTRVELSVGGADPVREERRDIDADGKPDLLLHYARHGQDQEPSSGLVALTTRSERLLALSFTHTLAPGHAFSGDACWLSVQQRPVLLVDWHEYGGDASTPTSSTVAYVVDEAGFKSITLFGVVAARAAEAAPLLAALGQPGSAEQGFAPPIGDCPLAPQPAAILTAPDGFVLVSGWSFSRATAGEPWPARLAKPSSLIPFQTASGQAFAWPPVSD